MPGAIVVKEIKPQRMNEKKLYAELMKGVRTAAKGMHKDFEATTKTWKHKPDFVQDVDTKASPVQILVGTDDEVYRYVNEGTKPHPIFAGIYTGRSNKKALSFRGGKYRPKTRPRVIGSFPGGPTGPRVARPYVQHPGTKARRFDKVIQKKWEPRFKRLMEQAMSRARKASGHAMPDRR